MENKLLHILEQAEEVIPLLLKNEVTWKSLYIDYEKPYVARLWIPWKENRIYLHKIYPCAPEEALFHPHPWPSAMKIVRGMYEMGVGYGKGKKQPDVAARVNLAAGSSYAMDNKEGWHYVAPKLEPAYTLMITGIPWKRWAPSRKQVLRELSELEKKELFSLFNVYYG